MYDCGCGCEAQKKIFSYHSHQPATAHQPGSVCVPPETTNRRRRSVVYHHIMHHVCCVLQLEYCLFSF
jgi:hypothetical protein